MPVGIHQFVRLLTTTLNILFPSLRCHVYASRRRQYVHLGLDVEFFTLAECDKVIETIRNFKISGFDINETHKCIFPTRVLSTRWKKDYIIFKRKK